MTSPENDWQWHPIALLALGVGAAAHDGRADTHGGRAAERGPARPKEASERLPVPEHDGHVRQPGSAEEHRLHEELDHRVQALGG